MDILIGILLNLAILSLFRYLLLGTPKLSFWLSILLLNGALIFVRSWLDAIIDRFAWDKINSHEADIILSLCVFLIPAVLGTTAMFAWSEMRKEQ